MRANQARAVRRIGILMNLAADDPEGQARVAAFLQGLQEAGWVTRRMLSSALAHLAHNAPNGIRDGRVRRPLTVCLYV
jgi:hypothetical protein